ncbi:MAG: hypothetical protein AVDCRST_MAG61-249, partial [uncultured Friedmanniella sp.]
ADPGQPGDQHRPPGTAEHRQRRQPGDDRTGAGEQHDIGTLPGHCGQQRRQGQGRHGQGLPGRGPAGRSDLPGRGHRGVAQQHLLAGPARGQPADRGQAPLEV